MTDALQIVGSAPGGTSEASCSAFRCEVESAINRHSMENGSNTPDFISRRDAMAKHVKELIEKGEYKNADGWEFRLIELRHIISFLRRSNAEHEPRAVASRAPCSCSASSIGGEPC